MKIKTSIAASAGVLLLTACGGASDETASVAAADTPPVEAELHPLLADVAAANYSLEKTHAFMTVKVGHGGGISQYRISFPDIDADLSFDPAAPESSEITFTINPAIVETNYRRADTRDRSISEHFFLNLSCWHFSLH